MVIWLAGCQIRQPWFKHYRLFLPTTTTTKPPCLLSPPTHYECLHGPSVGGDNSCTPWHATLLPHQLRFVEHTHAKSPRRARRESCHLRHSLSPTSLTASSLSSPHHRPPNASSLHHLHHPPTLIATSPTSLPPTASSLGTNVELAKHATSLTHPAHHATLALPLVEGCGCYSELVADKLAAIAVHTLPHAPITPASSNASTPNPLVRLHPHASIRTAPSVCHITAQRQPRPRWVR